MKKILIVEDEPQAVKLLSEKLNKKGYTLITALDGKAGLKMALSEHPDLILLDIIMPKMDGISILRELRKDAWGKTVEVVILTNLSDETKSAEAIELGTHDYLIKTDWSLNDLLKVIESKIG